MPDISQAKWLILIISSHIALGISLHRGLNVTENMQVFRHGESEFYDLNRRLLDTPDEFGNSREEQLEFYFKSVADLRRFVRRQETESAPVVDYKKKIGQDHLMEALKASVTKSVKMSRMVKKPAARTAEKVLKRQKKGA